MPDALILGTTEDHVNRLQQKPRADKKKDGSSRCYRCNAVGHFAKDCRRSVDHTCEKCGKKGHFAVVCRTGNKRQGKFSKKNKKVDMVLAQEEEDCAQTDEPYAFHCKTGQSDSFDFIVANTGVKAIVDSGASCNIMAKSMFERIQNKAKSNSDIKISPCNVNVYTYSSQEPLPVLGRCSLPLKVRGSSLGCDASFIVVADVPGGNQPVLLGRATSEELGILRIGLTYMCKPVDIMDKMRGKYPDAFSGLGKVKGYKLKLHIDPDVTPVVQHRRIPFGWRQKVNDKLEELEKMDVIEKVNGPTSWVNPLVCVQKPSGDIRICLDMRRANEAIKREKHPVPTVEETLSEMAGAKVFCKLDLNMAFHQIELDEDSRDITTFSGPHSLYRYKRLVFGVNMATEKFQHIISQIIKGCPGAHNMHDDICVVGMHYDELLARVDQVIGKLHSFGLTLNYSKCSVGESMNFMGHILSAEGLSLSEEKVKAIQEAPTPSNKQELRSFLGLAQFCSRYVMGFASITADLYALTAADAQWEWKDHHSRAFATLKEKLSQPPTMVFYNDKLPTRVVTDASSVGLGAILEQKQEDGNFHPVYYASRKLSKVEQRYSQFEREALGVKWACQKFILYLSGIDFQVCTDHKPLLKVFSRRSKAPSARIERWLLFLQQFSYTIQHISGKQNHADVLSRLPLDTEDCTEEQETEHFAHSVVEAAVPAALTIQRVLEETMADADCTKLKVCILQDTWDDYRQFQPFKEELWLHDELIMRGHRLFIPTGLRDHVLQLAHSGHQGIVRTKSRLREKVWWPGMDTQVEKMVQSCHPCQLVSPRPKPEPLKPSDLPEGPWEEIAIDLLDVSDGEHLLVITDYYSRWPEAILMRKTDAGRVIAALESVFITHGLPWSIRSDNGPPFSSREFEAFLDYLGIVQRKGIPYWPQSNGAVERLNETLLKIIRIAKLTGKDWKKELPKFLFEYRTTPHSSTGVSPAQALMGRTLRTKLPQVTFDHGRLNEADWQIKLRERDAFKKMRMMKNANSGRQPSNIAEGDQVLLQKKRDNKLCPNYETEPYSVVRREGNALTLQDPHGQMKMRSTGHVRKFVQDNGHTAEDSISFDDHNTTELVIESDATEEVSEHVTDPSMHALRKSDRVRKKPSWLNDFVV